MKHLFKFLMILFVTGGPLQSFAQNIGVRAGLNMSNMVMKDNHRTYSEDLSTNPGIQIGLIADFPIQSIFSFETGVLLSSKGYRESEEFSEMGNTYKFSSSANLMYLEIPLAAKASYDIGGVKVYGNFGPYIGMGIAGKYKWNYSYSGESEKGDENINWGNNPEDEEFRRLDYGLTMGAGVEIYNFQIGLNYGLGLANISSYNDDGFRTNNRILGITVGYFFNKN
jgi:hypothetical protein